MLIKFKQKLLIQAVKQYAIEKYETAYFRKISYTLCLIFIELDIRNYRHGTNSRFIYEFPRALLNIKNDLQK